MRIVFVALAAVLSGCVSFGPDRVAYLDEFDLSAMSCGMGMRPQSRKSLLGKSIRLGDKTYERGVGTHSESVILFHADGRVKAFDAVVGIDRDVEDYGKTWRTGKNWGSCVFRVYADGVKVADSGVIKETDSPKMIHADLNGAKTIILECSDGGHWAGYLCGHGDWADARFTIASGGELKPAWNDPLLAQWGRLTPALSSAPRINGASVWGVRPGHPIIYRVPVSGARPMKLSAANLPDGATFDAEKGIIGGVVEKDGVYPVEITAENSIGKATRMITLKVGERISLTPPMGWNSWNLFNGKVTDAEVRRIARAMHESGLGDHGWSYVNIDDCWMKRVARVEPDDLPHHSGPARDAAGRYIPQAKFPDMKALGDYIHSFGFKYGIYSSPGKYTCGRCEGSLGHEQIDADTWAEWGVDYLKYDWCSYKSEFEASTNGREPTVDDYAKPYRLMSKCLRAQNRDILHAFCQYGQGDVQSWGEEAGAQVWRSWSDLKDSWACLINATESYADAYKFTCPGFWCDPDMLVIGYLDTDFGMHETFLTPNEQYSHMSLWVLLNAPLLLGCDLEKMSEFTKGLVMNDEVLAISQDELGRQAGRASHDEQTDIWVRPLANGDSAAGVVNRCPFARRVTFDFAAAGLKGREYAVRDLWRQRDMGTYTDKIELEIPGHATFMVRLSRECSHCESRK